MQRMRCAFLIILIFMWHKMHDHYKIMGLQRSCAVDEMRASVFPFLTIRAEVGTHRNAQLNCHWRHVFRCHMQHTLDKAKGSAWHASKTPCSCSTELTKHYIQCYSCLGCWQCAMCTLFEYKACTHACTQTCLHLRSHTHTHACTHAHTFKCMLCPQVRKTYRKAALKYHPDKAPTACRYSLAPPLNPDGYHEPEGQLSPVVSFVKKE